jgi:hypothetical protein
MGEYGVYGDRFGRDGVRRGESYGIQAKYPSASFSICKLRADTLYKVFYFPI